MEENLIDSALVWGYNIPADDKLREDVSVMCNLSQGIRETGIAEGIAEGKAASEEKIILNMYRKGYTSEQIADIVEKNISDVEEVIQKKEISSTYKKKFNRTIKMVLSHRLEFVA